jgi:type I restriction enzyme S subunit
VIEWRPLKRFCVGGGEYGLNVSTDAYSDSGIRLLRTTDINRDGQLRSDIEPIRLNSSIQEVPIISPGDVLFSRSGTLGRAYLHAPGHEKMTYAGYLVRFQPRIDTDGRYLKYCSQASFFERQIATDAVTSTISNFNAERYNHIRLPWHCLRSQHSIANFLDAETARIDAVIAKKRQLELALLERILTVIDATIWNHDFHLERLRNVARFIDYRGATPAKAESGVPLITASHVKDGNLDTNLDPQWLSPTVAQQWMRRGLPSIGDVVLTTEAPLGNVAQITEERVALAQRLIMLKPHSDRILSDFLALALRAPSFQNILSAHATGSTALGIKADRLKALHVPVPTLTDQEETVEAIKEQSEVVNFAARSLNAQIGLLQEHRQALITAAVTGEMEVSGVAR